MPLVLKKEHPGYIMNVLLHAVLLTADALVIEGIATREDVDRTYMANLKTPMGPFGIMDMIGLDLIFSHLDKRSSDTLQARAANYFEPYVKRGEFGMKTGKGFYSYPAPSYQQPGFLTSESPDTAVYHEMVVALIQSAVLIALQEVADTEDIDRTWTIATGQELGPFGLLDKIGVDKLLETSQKTPQQLRLLAAEDNELVEAYLKQY